MIWRRAAAVVTVVGLLSSNAGAAPETAQGHKSADERTARELYKKGITAYNLGEYDKAVAELKRAYELSEAPPLLFNIAQAYRAKHDHAEALVFYRNYLRLVPGADNRADAEALALEMEQKAAIDERNRQAAAAEEATHQRAREEAAEKAAQQQQEESTRRFAEEEAARRAERQAAEQRVALSLSQPAPPPKKPLYKKWWLWTTIGGVVVVGTVAAVVATTASPHTVLPSGSLGTIDGR